MRRGTGGPRDGEAARQRSARRACRRDEHRGLRSPATASGARGKTASRGRPSRRALCRGRSVRSTWSISGPSKPCRSATGDVFSTRQSAGDVDAHDGGGMPCDRRVDRRQAQPLRGPGALLIPGEGRVRVLTWRAAHSSIQRPTRRYSAHWRERFARTVAGVRAAAASHERRRTSRDRACGQFHRNHRIGRPMPPSRKAHHREARLISAREGSDHRRRRRHGPVGEMRGGGGASI